MIPNGFLHAGTNILDNGISNALSDKPFFDNWGFSAGTGFVGGAYSGYQLSKEGGLNYWWGNEVGGGRNQWSFINSPTLEYRLDEYINNNYSQNELKLFYGDPDIKVGTNKNLEKFNARNVDGNIQLKDGRAANGFITGGVQRGENITNADLRISKNTVRNLDTWGRETVAHELYHSADYRFGNYIRDIYKYGITNAERLMEFRAYQYNYLRTVNFMYLSNAWRYATFFLP